MDKDERKKSLKEYRDFLRELMVKPQEEYPDAEHIIREDIIDSIVFDDVGCVVGVDSSVFDDVGCAVGVDSIVFDAVVREVAVAAIVLVDVRWEVGVGVDVCSSVLDAVIFS